MQSMNISRLFITLVAVPVLFFSATAYSKNINHYESRADFLPERAYFVVDVRPNGQIIESNGFSNGGNLNEILNDLQIISFPEDKISVFPDLYLEMGGKITIKRAPRVNLYDGKKYQLLHSWSSTIEELFKEKDIALGMEDKTSLPLDSKIEDNMQIKISRVAKTVIVESEEIKYKVVKKEDPTMEKGNKVVEQKGLAGVKELSYLVTRVDGEEVSKSYISTKIVTESVDEVVRIGSKVIVYGTGKATWYVATNEMIAAHNSLPRGTKVVVVNQNNGKRVTVTIKGGGISHSDSGVIIDLSTAAFKALGASLGTGKLESIRIEKYYSEE
ncbi:MAG: Resuscitation-promoting factor Rpf2 precursor [bacterium ADurb.Bin212]|nr:MAG: Resuscitation-promoting factor Rpf2 precursor [bacterium ADurb.Bin212]